MNIAKPANWARHALPLHFPILFILLIGGIGVLTITSCSDDVEPIEGRPTAEELAAMASSSSLSSSSGVANPSSSSSEEQKLAVSGVSQKGPFVNNSSVTLYELGSNFVQTGRSFQGMTNDSGRFEIKGIELASPYALLKADGFYRNEVSGNVSGSQITLYAITDMTGKNSVNANILTHLEYYRVQSLVEGGKSLAQAKKQALGEILAVFGIDGSGFKNSEDMSIFGTSESDAALLAISVLLQSNLSEGSFSALLGDFSQKFKESGVWDNKAKKAEIAAWAASADTVAIRNSILGWHLSPSVPNFGKYIAAYAAANASIGDCAGLNPAEEFCHANRAYSKCGDANGLGKHDYDPETQFCHNNYTVPKCGGQEFNPPDEQCNVGVVQRRCGSMWYSINSEFCHEGSVFGKCGGTIAYNPSTQFCHTDNNIYDKPSSSSSSELSSSSSLSSSSISSSSSIVALSSSSVELSSSSAEPSSSSVVVASSSSVVVGTGLCADFVDGTEREHYGKMKKQFCDERDGTKYVYVTIGTQTWMAENLNYEVGGSKCYSNNNSNCVTYGRLYNWATAMNNVCPSGWHLPSDAEWGALMQSVNPSCSVTGDCANAGKLLKTASGWYNNGNGNGTDNHGFSALPGGYGYSDGSFTSASGGGDWWSATERDSYFAYIRFVAYSVEYAGYYSYLKGNFLSVRCVQD